MKIYTRYCKFTLSVFLILGFILHSTLPPDTSNLRGSVLQRQLRLHSTQLGAAGYQWGGGKNMNKMGGNKPSADSLEHNLLELIDDFLNFDPEE